MFMCGPNKDIRVTYVWINYRYDAMSEIHGESRETKQTVIPAKLREASGSSKERDDAKCIIDSVLTPLCFCLPVCLAQCPLTPTHTKALMPCKTNYYYSITLHLNTPNIRAFIYLFSSFLWHTARFKTPVPCSEYPVVTEL